MSWSTSYESRLTRTGQGRRRPWPLMLLRVVSWPVRFVFCLALWLLTTRFGFEVLAIAGLAAGVWFAVQRVR